MDSKKLNKLCDEARIQSFTVSETFVDNDAEKEKIQKLKNVIRRINLLEQTKRKIVEEVRITEQNAQNEIECVKLRFSECTEVMHEFLGKAFREKNRAKTIKYIEELLLNFDFLEEQRIRLEILRERLSFEEVEHDNQ